MGRKDKRKAAARATAARMAVFHARNNIPNSPTSSEGYLDIDNVIATDNPTTISLDSDSDCGYDGTVNYCWSDSDSDEYLDVDVDTSDAESLEELEGDALEENLSELRAELEHLGAPTQYDLIMEPKSSKQWEKAEKNRILGYTGTSQRTQQRKAKEAREREKLRAESRAS